MAELSNQLMALTVLVYLAAIVCYAGEYAFGQRSRIGKDFEVTDGGAGHAEKDPKTGEPTGILRNCTRYVKVQSSGREPTEADRTENIRRVAEVARLMVDAGLIVLVSFISPYRSERQFARSLFGEDEFIEVFVDTPLEECERRDVKGLYAKARSGQLPNFTGIESPYEPPVQPEVHLRTTDMSVDTSAEQVFSRLP